MEEGASVRQIVHRPEGEMLLGDLKDGLHSIAPTAECIFRHSTLLNSPANRFRLTHCARVESNRSIPNSLSLIPAGWSNAVSVSGRGNPCVRGKSPGRRQYQA